MALYRDPLTVLLEVIEQKNGIRLDPADYDLSTPEPYTPPAGNSSTANTKVVFTANNVAAPYQGEITFYYNRLDLHDVQKMVELTLRSPELLTTHDVLPSLNRRFGLNLKESDIVLRDTDAYDGYRIATLEATETSLGWIGQATVTVAEGDLDLEEHLTVTSLGGLEYPTPFATRPFAYFYSYWRDLSTHHAYLDTIETGDPIGLSMTSVLNDVTKDVWVATGQSEYSLNRAEIIYAGSTQDHPQANTAYDRVIEIALNHDDCTMLTGNLLLHYSEPEDPNAYVGGNDG